MTTQELQQAYTDTIQGYLAALDRYTDDQFAAKPTDHEWSLGQMYEHLYVSTTYFFLANTKRCLEKRKGQEGGRKERKGVEYSKVQQFSTHQNKNARSCSQSRTGGP